MTDYKSHSLEVHSELNISKCVQGAAITTIRFEMSITPQISLMPVFSQSPTLALDPGNC